MKYLGEGKCWFSVWAPRAQKVEVHLVDKKERFAPLSPNDRGYHEGLVEGVKPGDLYFFRLDGDKERPDPASRLQPQGVHGPSQVCDTSFRWGDERWRGLPLSQYVTYELHVGTFTPEGTF